MIIVMVSSEKLMPNLLAIRFDFGVPLEDIFPTDNLHPRLRYLFSKAFQAWLETEATIEYILKNKEGSLEERLSLKEKLVLDQEFDWAYPSGTYFWVLRHFFGLLPIPLLPKYSNTVVFQWEHLGKECKEFLESYKYYQSKNCESLDYSIAESFCMLPFPHYLLLNFFVSYLKRLSIRKRSWGYNKKRVDKNAVLALVKYFCSAIFLRPYRPGHTRQTDPYQCLLIYLILRWKSITKYCSNIGHPAKILPQPWYFSSENREEQKLEIFSQRGKKPEMEKYNDTRIKSERFAFNPDVITVFKHFPLILERQKMYLRETGCQTETDLSDKEQNLFETCIESNRFSNTEPYKLTFFDTETILEQPDEHDENIDLSDTVFQSAADFSFNSVLNNENWEKIKNETMKTVKKVDEYIYDDYETFKREEYNQIVKENPRLLASFKSGSKTSKNLFKTNFVIAEIHQSTPRSSLGPEENRDKIYDGEGNNNVTFDQGEEKINLTFEVEKDGCHNTRVDIIKDKTNSSSEKEGEQDTSYEKFPDVFDEDPEILNVIHENSRDIKLNIIEEKPHLESFEEKCNYFENLARDKFGNEEKLSPNKSTEFKTPEKLKTPKSFKKLFEKSTKKSFEDVAKNIPLKDRIEELDVSSENDLHSPNRRFSRKKYVLKRIRMSFEFLRTLTPKKSNWLEKKVKYERVKRDKFDVNRSNSI